MHYWYSQGLLSGFFCCVRGACFRGSITPSRSWEHDYHFFFAKTSNIYLFLNTSKIVEKVKECKSLQRKVRAIIAPLSWRIVNHKSNQPSQFSFLLRFKLEINFVIMLCIFSDEDDLLQFLLAVASVQWSTEPKERQINNARQQNWGVLTKRQNNLAKLHRKRNYC